jgi:NADPH:quinone reductase-like Zn-dependent oxidoreductase
VTHVKAGDAVYGMIPIRGGAFAEYATPKGHELALKPQSLDYEQAAAVPLASLAAWQTLIDFAKVQDGERVLILGAAGNVGSVAVQLAKQNGAYVIACDLAGRENFLLELGADELIDAGTQKFEEQVKDIDIVLNYASADLLERAYSVIKSGGRYATTFGQPDPVEAELHGIRSFGVFTQPTVEHLTRLANMIDANKLKVFVQNTFPLDATQAALNYRLPAGQAGKVVLTVS